MQDPQQIPVSETAVPPLGSNTGAPALPPRPDPNIYHDNVGDPANYTRDPHRLIAYLIPFPAPALGHNMKAQQIPTRFLVYTPPPPPLNTPAEGEQESKSHKVQRKWQNEVREAKQSTAKTASWKGVKSKATKGIAWAMNQVKSADVEFLNRIPNPSSTSKSPRSSSEVDRHGDDGLVEGNETHRTVGLEEMVLVYPTSFQYPPEKVREEFVSSMMRTKSKAQKDAILATGLLPVSAAIDILATVIWPFGGLLEVDGVWAYTSIRGAKSGKCLTYRVAPLDTNSTSSTQCDQASHLIQLW